VEDSGRDGLVLIRNFLGLAREWGGYAGRGSIVELQAAPGARAVALPEQAGFAGVWWLDTPGVRKGDWNGVVTLYRVGDLLGGYYRNGKGVGIYCGTVGPGGEAEGELWWEQGSHRNLWRFRYAVSEDGRALLGGPRALEKNAFTREGGIRIEGGASLRISESLPEKGRISYTSFGPLTGFWRTVSDRVEAEAQDPILRLKQRGNVTWGYVRSPKTRGFGFLLGVTNEKGEFTGRFWWREKESVDAFAVEFVLAEDTESFRGRYRKSGGEWKPWNGVRTY
jgi:hypothetical protein